MNTLYELTAEGLERITPEQYVIAVNKLGKINEIKGNNKKLES